MLPAWIGLVLGSWEDGWGRGWGPGRLKKVPAPTGHPTPLASLVVAKFSASTPKKNHHAPPRGALPS